MMEKLKWVSDQQQRLTTRSSDRHHGTAQSFEKDRMYGFSWPQRNYRCSFCKKEFKSAQALGGHMNVHRRDRARMRQLSPPPPPPDHFHNYPTSSTLVNPNPSTFSQLSASSTLPHHHHEFLLPYYNNLSSSFDTSATNDPSSRGGDGETKKKKKDKGTMLELTETTAAGFAARKKDARVWKANHEYVRLDLSLGLFKDSKEDLDLDLDLELRLGYS